MIHLVGPGGAGKTTVGSAFAARLGLRFVDLDEAFRARHGDVSVLLDTLGYEAYAERNVGLYLDLAGGSERPDVVALSSGFMVYPPSVRPDYAVIRQRIASSSSTIVLLPSLDLEACVAETVRRQIQRPFARSAEREEQVIRTRFPLYVGLSARKVETARPVERILADVMAAGRVSGANRVRTVSKG